MSHLQCEYSLFKIDVSLNNFITEIYKNEFTAENSRHLADVFAVKALLAFSIRIDVAQNRLNWST